MLVKHLETQSSRYKNRCFDFGIILCGATISHRDSPVVELPPKNPIPTGNCLEGEGANGGVFRDSSIGEAGKNLIMFYLSGNLWFSFSSRSFAH